MKVVVVLGSLGGTQMCLDDPQLRCFSEVGSQIMEGGVGVNGCQAEEQGHSV